MLNSTFSLTGNQFNLIISSRSANFLVTKPAHMFCRRWRRFLDKQGRNEIQCRHSSGVRELGSLRGGRAQGF